MIESTPRSASSAIPSSSIPAGYPVFSATTSSSTRSTAWAVDPLAEGAGRSAATATTRVPGAAGSAAGTGRTAGDGVTVGVGAGAGIEAGAGAGAAAGAVPGKRRACCWAIRAERVRWAWSCESRNCLCSRAVCSCNCCRAASVCWVSCSAWVSPDGGGPWAGSGIGVTAVAGGGGRSAGAGRGAPSAAGGRGARLGRGETAFAPQTGTVSPGRASAAGRHRLPASQAASRTAYPRAASRPRRCPKSSTPGRLPEEASRATASAPGIDASESVCSASRVSTDPGPTSTNVRTPAAAIARTWSANRTGWASWWPSRSRAAAGSAGYSAAVELAKTGLRPGPNSTPSRAARNGAAASATSGLWNAAATGNRAVRTPLAANACSAFSTSAVGPDSTDWAGAF